MFGTGQRMHGEVRDLLVDHPGGTGRAGGHSRRSGMCRSLSQRFKMGWGTLVDFRDGSGTLGEVRDGSGNPR